MLQNESLLVKIGSKVAVPLNKSVIPFPPNEPRPDGVELTVPTSVSIGALIQIVDGILMISSTGIVTGKARYS